MQSMHIYAGIIIDHRATKQPAPVIGLHGLCRMVTANTAGGWICYSLLLRLNPRIYAQRTTGGRVAKFLTLTLALTACKGATVHHASPPLSTTIRGVALELSHCPSSRRLRLRICCLQSHPQEIRVVVGCAHSQCRPHVFGPRVVLHVPVLHATPRCRIRESLLVQVS